MILDILVFVSLVFLIIIYGWRGVCRRVHMGVCVSSGQVVHAAV